MKKEYVVNYDCGSGEITFEIDEEKFKDVALATLEFYGMSYEEDEGPVIEGVRKYAEACMRYCMQNETTSVPYIVSYFEAEGYCKPDGEFGILLKDIYYPEIDENAFEVTIKDIEKEEEANV